MHCDPGPGAAQCRGDGGAGQEAELVSCTVQLSRFHLETLPGQATGDVDIRALCIAVGGSHQHRELLQDAHLSLRRGVRYGLVGRNGCGKSTLMRAMASKAIPSMPQDMKVCAFGGGGVGGRAASAKE